MLELHPLSLNSAEICQLNTLKWIQILAVFNNALFLIVFMTDLKSRYDEERSLREAAEQRLAKMTEQLQSEQQENEKLQSELVQHMKTFKSHSNYVFKVLQSILVIF